MLSRAVVVLLVALVERVQAEEPSIEAKEGNIMMVVEAGQKVGFTVGDKTVLFNEMADFPTAWRDYSDSMMQAMSTGYSIGTDKAATSTSNHHLAIIPANIPGFGAMSWSEIEQLAAGSTVNFWMWDGSDNINNWVDKWLQPRLQKKYQISIKRAPNQGAGDAVAQVAKEMGMAPTADTTTNCPMASPAPCGGAVDMIWINKENFRVMKQANNLFGPWANKVPSASNFDFFSPGIAFDAGTPTQGFEFPYNSAQVVFFHNTVQLPSPPKTMPDMVTWIMANKGKFAYSHVNDFTGAVVVQQFFYHYAGAEVGGSWKDFLGDFNEPLYLKRAPLVWQTLRSIESSLKMSSDGSYPAAHTIIRDWFAADEVWLDCSYDPNHAAQYILSGKYKETTKSYVLDTGTISNTNFVAIAANANNKAAAMVVGNMIGSLEAVFTRAQPERWGALPAIAANKQSVVDSGWDAAFDYIDSHASAPSVEELAAGRLTELRADYVQRLKTDWVECVVNKNERNLACGF